MINTGLASLIIVLISFAPLIPSASADERTHEVRIPVGNDSFICYHGRPGLYWAGQPGVWINPATGYYSFIWGIKFEKNCAAIPELQKIADGKGGYLDAEVSVKEFISNDCFFGSYGIPRVCMDRQHRRVVVNLEGIARLSKDHDIGPAETE